MTKKWFKKNYRWAIGVVLIPLIIAFLSLINSSSSTQNIQNISTDEISGGIIGNNNTFHVMNQKQFSGEHIKLIERRRKYINENIHIWYDGKDADYFLSNFNDLVDQLIDAAQNGETILFQETLRDIHYLSIKLELYCKSKNPKDDPGMHMMPGTKESSMAYVESGNIYYGRVINILTRGDNTDYYAASDSSKYSLDSIYSYQKINSSKKDTLRSISE
ncbi:hypothetical protein [Christiangramia echinicola]|uniref:Uncharacterized protein n=1 Tax=Christiangramia echinicola TaxID=279359 RepID=A0A1H1KV33_9FLAO|nr:hypothetical protein [Christiangramia echinicola]SDR66184.1 hypothetical protein SAMN04488552_0253 [Christiangramia echinicola]